MPGFFLWLTLAMAFAERYIRRNMIYLEFIQDAVDYLLEIIVVVPVYNEQEITKMLNSLSNCEVPGKPVEILLVINQSEKSESGIISQNEKTIQEIDRWKLDHPDTFFDLHVLVPPPFPQKHAGAGLARKTGMDEAIRRFSTIEKEDGIIISLDADTLVDRNYFVEIENHFRNHQNQVGVCIRFQHRINEIEDEHHQKGMLLYEKYLRYYKNALTFTGYPHAIHTVGSAFAVKADAYVKQGGMNRRQAGEDFYFLHKLSQLGEIGELNSTCVYPSGRLSDRVPFGTGPALQKWMKGDKSLTETYCFQAFRDLRSLFDLLPEWFELDIESCKKGSGNLSEPIDQFFEEDGFWEALDEIKNNSSRLDSFEKRFYQYFNAFKILKFLNFSHPDYYAFQNLSEADAELTTSIHVG